MGYRCCFQEHGVSVQNVAIDYLEGWRFII